MTIGVVADTHGLVRPRIAEVFAGVDMILHAGDVGGQRVLDALARIAPVQAVSGNVDDRHDPALRTELVVAVDSVTIHVSHGDELGRPTPGLVLARYAGDVVIFGHTHRAVVQRTDDGRMAVNPGAAGPRRFDIQPSVAKLIVRDGRAEVEVISLA